jgi:hypothetical protein
MSHQEAMVPTVPAEHAHRLAQGLGWFSIGLGLAEVLAPNAIARWLGMPESKPILQTYGVREISTGIAILTSKDPQPWVWGRVAGDGLDLATLASGYRKPHANKGNISLAIAAVAGATLLDVVCAQSLGRQNGAAAGKRVARQAYNYSQRTGFPKPVHEMQGAARDFQVPEDMQTPALLRPFPTK